jgi:hypothetical protein
LEESLKRRIVGHWVASPESCPHPAYDCNRARHMVIITCLTNKRIGIFSDK